MLKGKNGGENRRFLYVTLYEIVVKSEKYRKKIGKTLAKIWKKGYHNKAKYEMRARVRVETRSEKLCGIIY